ncbi:uncharacterized protein LOC127728240 [Mytilus californianus]|uniref:uncharacterized protein LOC127728240 n=1 Tax=Mytilus californianus TaxID=6549 RepID=UPI0022479156|nr:uncharacterized protein LOC127728240 [Mytilus californianus]XP_052091471.1 uncharacterized protein LOC127728240 [Mytilus californianus]
MTTEEFTCPICFDGIILPKILECGHTFCLKCIKDYSDDIKTDNRDLVCPLCRSKFNLPKRGPSQLITNYFVNIPKPQKYCLNCQKTEKISSFCLVCGSLFCKKCFKSHIHSIVNNNSPDDENDEDELSIPLHLLLQGVRTMFTCKLQSYFVIDIPQNNDGSHIIHSVRASKYGGVYVVPDQVNFILKFDQTDRIQEKIRIKTPPQLQCSGVIETDINTLLGTFPVKKLILKYASSCWSIFATCYDFHPLDLVELSNGNILACGPNRLLVRKEKFIKRTGNLQVYSIRGEPLFRLDKLLGNTKTLAYPSILAYDKNRKAISVVDQENKEMIVIHEKDKSCYTYNGSGRPIVPFPLSLFGIGDSCRVQFFPLGLCGSSNGLFMMTSNDECLHMVDRFGKLVGVGQTDDNDNFGRLVTIDEKGGIWCSDPQNGAIKTFKVINYRNELDGNKKSGIRGNITSGNRISVTSGIRGNITSGTHGSVTSGIRGNITSSIHGSVTSGIRGNISISNRSQFVPI